MLPIAYVQTTAPKHRARNWCVYTPEGRAEIHKTLEKVNMKILHYLMENPVQGESVEFNDNRLALYCAQQGKCAISGRPLTIGDMHCHHKTRKSDGGDDRYTKPTPEKAWNALLKILTGKSFARKSRNRSYDLIGVGAQQSRFRRRLCQNGH